jgi:hypothetical protein
MYGRPMLGNQRMVTVATRIEPDELSQLKTLAQECGLSVCGYLRDLIRLELARAGRSAENNCTATAPVVGSQSTDRVQ